MHARPLLLMTGRRLARLAAAVAFKVMDTDRDQVVSADDLFWHLKGLLGHVLNEAQLEQVGAPHARAWQLDACP
jgi:hypothetical protein